jgi:tRNA threonylcarbamoyladenosine biosynthesis protein TsaE
MTREGLTLRTAGVAETLALAERAAGALGPGDVVALIGELGTGKTRFVAGAARGLGYAGRVRSPSFTLLNVYRGARTIYHFDLYRWDPEARAAEWAEWEELMDGEGVTFIEWAERLGAALPERAWRVAFTARGEDRRELALHAPAERLAELRARLAPWTAA